MNRTPNSRYTGIAIALHWAMAILLLFMIWLGWNMEGNESRFQLHKSIGITLLFLAVIRIVWRKFNPPPPLPDMPSREAKLSHWVHVAFYALFFIIPVAGWILVSSSKFAVPTVLFGTISWPHLPFMAPFKNDIAHAIIETIHSKGAWALIILLGLHIAGAIKHEIKDEDGVLKRMLPGLFGKTQAPQGPPRGFLPAFGGALALFAIIAAIPIVTGGSTKLPDTPAATSQASASALAVDANWTVDDAASSIAFSGTHEGKPFSGTFESWTADIFFEPATPHTGKALVRIAAGSASTGTKLYDDSLKSPEWFNSSGFPGITVLVDDMRPVENSFTATATLKLKDKVLSVPIAYTLDIAGDTAVMRGRTILSRKALNIGQVSDPTSDYVSNDIRVDIALEATRN